MRTNEELEALGFKGRILRLPMSKKWFDMTYRGAKTEDYRELDDHWKRVLIKPEKQHLFASGKPIPLNKRDHDNPFNQYDYVYEHIGNGEHCPEAIYKCKEVIACKGVQLWGAEVDKLYFTIKLGERLELPEKADIPKDKKYKRPRLGRRGNLYRLIESLKEVRDSFTICGKSQAQIHACAKTLGHKITCVPVAVVGDLDTDCPTTLKGFTVIKVGDHEE